MSKSLDKNELSNSSECEGNDKNPYYSVPTHSINSVNEDVENGWQSRDYLDTKLLVSPSSGKSFSNVYPPQCIDMLRSSMLVKGNELKSKKKCCEFNVLLFTIILFVFLIGSCIAVWCLYFTNAAYQNDKNLITDISTFDKPVKIYHFHNDDINPSTKNHETDTKKINKDNIAFNKKNQFEKDEDNFFPPMFNDIIRMFFVPFDGPDHQNNTDQKKPSIIRIIRIRPMDNIIPID